jgi:purine-nucleoside/S-methyl-5'-thioadenosine phosphorylase / adenosine deaminase
VTAQHDWIIPDWPAPARVKSLITTRRGGVSAGVYAGLNLGLRTGDDEAAVRANLEQVRACLPQEPKWLRQVHGSRVVAIDGLTEIPEADGSVARQAGTVCVVVIADCMPVLLCDQAGGVVGIAHAGWRGLSSGVIENTVSEMGVAPARLLAYLGPAIGPGAFEVGADVRDAFLAADSGADQAFMPCRDYKWLADLFQLARRRLARCGVRQVYGGGLCTYSDPAHFYSYRRDKTTGRMAALIWLAPGSRT